ncbi:MAG: hypothetical protein SVR94_08275, partial [Pseudomonadota bacterium]|nr:hypothetical protein [Pseudomonadota bacterium]
HADFYLLNPAGLLFGKHAVLDIKGSFYASTADKLRLGTQGEFNARLPEDSLLTVAQPTAFGFLTSNPAPIIFKNSTLTVNKGKNLAFIGGDLIIDNEQLGRHFNFRPHQVRPEFQEPMDKLVNDIWVNSGYLYLASLASAGEIGLSKQGFSLSADIAGGDITAHNALISARGEGGGQIFIRGGDLKLTHSVIENSVENQQTQGKINIQADNLNLEQGSVITSTTQGDGNGGSIQIKLSGHLILTGEAAQAEPDNIYSSGIYGSTQASGTAGSIEISANQVYLKEGAQIASGSFSSGAGSQVMLTVTDTLSIRGEASNHYRSGIYGSSEAQSAQAGDAGTVHIQARQIILTKGVISTDTWGGGQGGPITLDKVQQITLEDNAYIASGSLGQGQGGQINIDTQTLKLAQSRILADSTHNDAAAGDAGNLSIRAQTIDLDHDSDIKTAATQALGGNISIQVSQRLAARNSAISTSVGAGQGDGGNIHIELPVFVILGQAQILAQAVGGDGGRIMIHSEQFIVSPKSLIDASSQLGIDGEVIIRSPEQNLSERLVLLPSQFLEAAAYFKQQCIPKIDQEISRFFVVKLAGAPHSPGEHQSSSLFHRQPDINTQVKQKSQDKNAVGTMAMQISCGQ